jgi:signal transduction histidine kinase
MALEEITSRNDGLGMISERGSRWTLLLGLSVVALIFLGAGVVGTVMIAGTVKTTRRLQEQSINSVELLSRVVRDLDQQRILVDDHIHEAKPASMTGIEAQLADISADLSRAEQQYTDLVEEGEEAELWHSAQVLIVRSHQVEAETLALSRKNLADDARARMTLVRSDYGELNRKLYELIQVNHDQALAATKHIETIQRSTEAALWAARIGTLLGLALLGWWMVRRVGTYERQVTDYARRLEEANRDLDAFAGRVAHDIKNALGPLALAPSLLRRLNGNPDRVLETAGRIERSSQRATAVVDSLLAFSRASRSAEAGESASLREVLKDTLDDLATRAAELQVSIEVGDIPDVQIRCNAGLLQVVLANVCGNAVKYLEGWPQRRVRIAAETENSSCRVDVEDTGPGIPHDAQRRIFEPFYRVQGVRAPGTGIGLATVRRIVDARGGRVTVESTEGSGSRFRLWLPLAPLTTDRTTPRDSPSTKPVLRH